MKKSVRPRKLVVPKANRQGFMAGVATLGWPPLGAQWDVHKSPSSSPPRRAQQNLEVLKIRIQKLFYYL